MRHLHALHRGMSDAGNRRAWRTRCASLYLVFNDRKARRHLLPNFAPAWAVTSFGCDICQDVCPWNRKAPVTNVEEFQPRDGMLNPNLDWLAEMLPEEFRAIFRGSPIRRAKLSGLRRNAVIAMGNSGDSKFLPTLKKLAEDPDAVVSEHATWALDKLTRETLSDRQH